MPARKSGNRLVQPDGRVSEPGYFGRFGGRFVSELLMPALDELTQAFEHYSHDKAFLQEWESLLQEFAGRPTRLYYAGNLSEAWGAEIYLKREDLLHTGAHKINNTLGQALMASKMGKKRLIAETGAGQHGVATATAAALLGLPACVYMGNKDLRRQSLNGFRMRLMGAEVRGVGGEKGTLRDAVNEALRDWSQSVGDTHYIVGSVIGPHPFPTIVRFFQSVIGREAREQIRSATRKLPDAVIACVGGGSNALGMFHEFKNDSSVELIGVEAGGTGVKPGQHSASISRGTPGILQGALTLILQDEAGMVTDVHSVSAGLDYPGVGPEHAWLHDSGRARYTSISDEEALEAFQELARREGIIPALETSHAVAYAREYAKSFRRRKGRRPVIVISLSGRGDKDVAEVQRILNEKSGKKSNRLLQLKKRG